MACGSSCGCNKPEEPEKTERPKDAPSFPFHAATYSLVAACAVIALLRISASQFRNGEDGRLFGLIAEAGGGLVAIAGLFFAVVAVANIGRCGADGLLGKGALGLMLNGGFILIIASNLVAGRERRAPAPKPQAPPAEAPPGIESSP